MCFMQMIMKDVKIMTFDEAIDELRLSIPEKFYSPTMHDIAVMLEVQTKVINLLREEYAPTVEMTQEQKEYYASRTLLSGMVFNQNTQYYTDEVHNIDRKIASAILHPETIKVVDE